MQVKKECYNARCEEIDKQQTLKQECIKKYEINMKHDLLFERTPKRIKNGEIIMAKGRVQE